VDHVSTIKKIFRDNEPELIMLSYQRTTLAVPASGLATVSFFGVGEATYTFNRDEQGQVKEMVYDSS